jgi:hypothetical protein
MAAVREMWKKEMFLRMILVLITFCNLHFLAEWVWNQARQREELIQVGFQKGQGRRRNCAFLVGYDLQPSSLLQPPMTNYSLCINQPTNHRRLKAMHHMVTTDCLWMGRCLPKASDDSVPQYCFWCDVDQPLKTPISFNFWILSCHFQNLALLQKHIVYAGCLLCYPLTPLFRFL